MFLSIIESVRSFIATCPLLKDGKMLRVDYLGDTEIEYTVDGDISEPIIRKYVDGSSLRQFNFIFASREEYSSDVLKNIANSDFYDKFATWIEQQSNIGNLPELGEFMTPQYLELMTSGYIFDVTEKTARYQIQLKFVYYQDRRKNNG